MCGDTAPKGSVPAKRQATDKQAYVVHRHSFLGFLLVFVIFNAILIRKDNTKFLKKTSTRLIQQNLLKSTQKTNKKKITNVLTPRRPLTQAQRLMNCLTFGLDSKSTEFY